MLEPKRDESDLQNPRSWLSLGGARNKPDQGRGDGVDGDTRGGPRRPGRAADAHHGPMRPPGWSPRWAGRRREGGRDPRIDRERRDVNIDIRAERVARARDARAFRGVVPGPAPPSCP